MLKKHQKKQAKKYDESLCLSEKTTNKSCNSFILSSPLFVKVLLTNTNMRFFNA